jgi:hypothetical protein
MGQKKTTIQTGTWSPTWGYSLEASASMAQYPTTDNKRIGTNYWVTGSTIIPASALNTGSFFVTSSLGLGPVNTSAKVSITSSYFTPLFNSNINDSNDVKKFSILSYNGVISTIAGFNEFSSSTSNDFTESFVVMFVSASKDNMGSVVTNDLIVSLGTTQNSSATNVRPTNTTGSNAAFEIKYPTNKTDWSYVETQGALVSPKNQ